MGKGFTIPEVYKSGWSVVAASVALAAAMAAM